MRVSGFMNEKWRAKFVNLEQEADMPVYSELFRFTERTRRGNRALTFCPNWKFIREVHISSLTQKFCFNLNTYKDKRCCAMNVFTSSDHFVKIGRSVWEYFGLYSAFNLKPTGFICMYCPSGLNILWNLRGKWIPHFSLR